MPYLIALVFSLWLHDIHISKSEVEFNPQSQSLQISTHIYIDDFEEIMGEELGAHDLYVGTEKETDSADYFIYKYVQNHLVFEIDNQPVNYEFIGKELSEDLLAVWVYLEVYNIENVSSLKITYDVLMNLYDDQKNILSLKIPDDGKSFYLFHSRKKDEFIEF